MKPLKPAFLLFVFVLSVVRCEATAGSLRLVDDRGLAIPADVDVCFQTGTRSDCAASRKGTLVAIPGEFVAVRAEGPEHGPVSVVRGNLKTGPDGLPVLTVPRKAELQVTADSRERIAVSLYSQDDPTFRSPSFRVEVLGGGSIKIPAGDHLISLLTPGRAPDLHLLGAPPASRQRLSYAARPGWSFVARCLTEREKTPVSGARLQLQGAEGFSSPGAQGGRQTLSSKGGLAIFSGIPHSLASATVEHPRFIRSRQEGISASPGTFAFREVRLEEGGALRITVTADGRPSRGVTCQVVEYEANPIGPAKKPTVHSESLTDPTGTCRSVKLAAGPYTLRLKVPESRSFVDRSVLLVNGEETLIAIPLSTIRVSGTVLKGDKPAVSYVVTFSDQNELKPNATRRDAQAETTTDEDGKYETVLWSGSDYLASLATPEGTPADTKRMRLENSEEHVDFHLEDQSVAGVVLDDRDRPVEGVRVMLSWNHRLSRLAQTGEKGTFLFPLSETGVGRVEAAKQGYLTHATAEIVAQPNTPIEPVILHLRRANLLSGRVLAGGPAAGASLLGYRVEPGGGSTYLGEALADGQGHFELAAAEGGPTRVFVTGSGCPLTAFDVQPAAEDLVLRCPDLPASLALQFDDKQGRPVAGRSVFARKDGVIIPGEVLVRHLSRFNLPAAADGGGRLFLVGLAPGNYDLFLADATYPELVAAGAQRGFLSSANLAPFTTTELQVTLEVGR